LIRGALYDDDDDHDGKVELAEHGSYSSEDETSEEEFGDDQSAEDSSSDGEERVSLRWQKSESLQIFASDRSRARSDLVLVPGVTTKAQLDGLQKTLGQVNYGFLAAQITACIDQCCSSASPPMLTMPRNLIDCRTLQVLSAQPVMSYVALSYVWGTDTPEAKLDDQGTMIELPQTVNDAIRVTLSLGQQYLWVDRYCIDQSDQEAKTNQINNMGSIYAGSWVTLVSTNAHMQTGLPGVSTIREERPAVQTTQGTIVSIESGDSMRNMIRESPWAKRGWTFQEAVLSPRILFFTTQQAYLLCDKVTIDEVASLKPQVTHSGAGAGLGKRNVLRFSTSWQASDILGSLQQYVRRDLTYDDDSLTALRGYLSMCGLPSFWGTIVCPIGSRTSEGMNSQRAEEGFMSMLLWYHESSKAANVLNSVPSWSWASQRRKVTFGTAFGGYLLPVGSETTPKMMARILLPCDATGELKPLNDLAQDPNLRGLLPEKSQVLGVRSRVHSYNIESAGKIRTKISFPFLALKGDQLGQVKLDLFPDRRQSCDSPAFSTTGTALLLRVGQRTVDFDLEAYWLAFENVDIDAQLVRRIGVIRLRVSVKESVEQGEFLRDITGIQHVLSKLEGDWEEGEHTLLKFF
jgi:hypothetical protein